MTKTGHVSALRERNKGRTPASCSNGTLDIPPPVWPDEPEAQQQMAHMDFAVNDLEEAVRHAIDCGATVASEQFSDGWRVMIDPAGHPFCLCQMKSIIESEHFALL